MDPTPNILISLFLIKALKLTERVLLSTWGVSKDISACWIDVFGGIKETSVQQSLIWEKDSQFWFKILWLEQELSLQGLCFLLQKKYCLLNLYFVCRLSRINSLVSLKYEFDSSLHSSITLETGDLPKPSRCLFYLCINPAFNKNMIQHKKIFTLYKHCTKHLPWLHLGGKKGSACLGMHITSFIQLEWGVWLLKAPKNKQTKKPLSCMFCLHFILNASLRVYHLCLIAGSCLQDY